MITPAAPQLVRRPVTPVRPPKLDEFQRAVVDHEGGPLLVLAGPGTGKTTTLVEAVARRVERGLSPEQVLVLTFSRKAAAELRDRITGRLGRTCAAPMAATFHSFCYALVRAYQPAELFATPLRLLSGPEQDVMVRELLRGSAETPDAWPAELRGCLTTKGFAEEVRAVLARARELGLSPEDLAFSAGALGRLDWAAVADFLGEYLDVLDARGVVDYSELVHRAVLLAERDDVRRDLRQRHSVVFVDEYQDTDPAQVRLLQAIAGAGRDLVVVGDPDQSIYAFRGADVSGILDFRTSFPRTDGSPADVRVLRVSRRAGPRLLMASRLVARRMPLARLPADDARDHRRLLVPDVEISPGSVQVSVYPSLAAELDGVADVLRRAHLEDGVPWSEMAVLVRSGVRTIPAARRALWAAGVPLEVAGDEIPLRGEPPVATLLTALRVADDPTALTPETARALLLSPLGGADPGDLRSLGRALRDEERLAAGRDRVPRMPRPSPELIREAVAEPETLAGIDAGVGSAPARLGRLVARARDVLAGGGSAEQALWELWNGTPWPRRLERAARRGGPAGRRADRDLDAVCALFDAAARAEERVSHLGVRNFLEEIEAQQIPGDSLAERPVRGDAVRLLTAHRSKGLEWRLVVVMGVQEGVWPDLRRRGSLLEPDRIGVDGLSEPLRTGAILAEERRLFYVAVTRARERLTVTAVRSASEDGDQPSRFLSELGTPVAEVSVRPRRALSLGQLVGDLRAALVDRASSDGLRRAAAARLAVLAGESDADGPLVPAADPERWWAVVDQTDPGVPVRDPDVPVHLSGSGLADIHDCALRWFLGREVHAESARTAALGFGSVIHALADDVAVGRVAADLPTLLDKLDRVWDQLAFEAPWQSVRQKEEARAALGRFLRWHAQQRGRMLAATEHEFRVTVRVGDREVLLRGFMDRVERADDGSAHVVDFKTGKVKPTAGEVSEHPQLGVYQLAVQAGALDAIEAFDQGRPPPGGAELVQLRFDEPDGLPLVQRQPPPARAEGGQTWIERMLIEALRRVLTEDFPPMPGATCSRCEFRRCCPAWPEGRQVIE